MELNQVVVAARSFGRAEPQGARMLEEAGLKLVYLPGEKPAADEIMELAGQQATVALIAGGDAITAEMINSSPNLKIIAMHGVGLSHIDRQAAAARNIEVRAVPGGNAEAVADITWGLMLAVARHIPAANDAVRRQDWQKFFGTSLNDKTIGIVGFGAIGRAVARRAAGFRMNILAYDVMQDENAARELQATYADIDTLLSKADFITLHVPLLQETRHLINRRTLALMQPSTILVNVSRGEVIDEEALCEALQNGKLAGAGLDVFSQEPLPVDHCLCRAPNCVLTPHIGARTRETMRHIGIETARNVLQALK